MKDAAIAALQAGFTKYTASPGIPELRQAIGEKLERDNGLKYAPEQVIVSSGAKHSLYNLFQALLSEGDEVIIFAPYWVSYPDMVRLAGGTPVIVEHPRGEQLRARPGRAEEGDHAPHPRGDPQQPEQPDRRGAQPPGARGDRRGARGRTGLLVVTDDIYEKLLYTDAPFANDPQRRARPLRSAPWW